MKPRLLAAILLAGLLLTGCSIQVQPVENPRQIYAGFYPVYALTAPLLENAEKLQLKCLTQPQDGCLRDYALSDWDLSVVAYDADAVVLAGRGLESFESSLYALGEDGPAVITAMTGAVLYNQGKTGGEETSHFETENPYYYLSIPGAIVMTEQICQGLAELYPDQGEIITENGEAARAKLENLRAECLEITGGCAGKKVAILNEAAIYPALDYGLQTVYQFDRESTTTVYGESMEKLAEEIRNSGAQAVLMEDSAPTELTEALEEAGFPVVKLNLMTAYAQDAGAEGYYEAQRSNARAIAEALGGEESN